MVLGEHENVVQTIFIFPPFIYLALLHGNWVSKLFYLPDNSSLWHSCIEACSHLAIYWFFVSLVSFCFLFFFLSLSFSLSLYHTIEHKFLIKIFNFLSFFSMSSWIIIVQRISLYHNQSLILYFNMSQSFWNIM